MEKRTGPGAFKSLVRKTANGGLWIGQYFSTFLVVCTGVQGRKQH